MTQSLVLLREGQADQNAMSAIIERIAVAHGRFVRVESRRIERSSLFAADPSRLERSLQTAGTAAPFTVPILITADADKDCAVEVAARVRAVAARVLGERRHAVVSPELKLESWFIVCLDDLAGKAGLAENLVAVSDPGAGGDALVERSLACNAGSRRVQSYSTEHARQLARVLDLELCRTRSKSFDKFVREVLRLIAEDG